MLDLEINTSGSDAQEISIDVHVIPDMSGMAVEKSIELEIPADWSVYVLLCKGNRLYAGITNRLDVRIANHFSGKGAKFTRSNPPVSLLAHRDGLTRSQASRLEYKVKQQNRVEKINFMKNFEFGDANG
jgi:putative endonuclease